MVIVRLKGGLGNQLFQYAAGLSLSKFHNTELKLDKSYLDTNLNSTITSRRYELNVFNIQANFAASTEVDSLTKYAGNKIARVVGRNFPSCFSKLFAAETGNNFQPNFFKYPPNTYLDGYWQSEKYFINIEEKLRNNLSYISKPNSENLDLIEKMLSLNSVALHIRRGDYLLDKTKDVYASCNSEYYNNAIEYVVRKSGNIKLFVFSDNIEWVQKNMDLPIDSIFVANNTGSNSFEDMRLMSMCKHNIIANSSFSWWGAWLNSNKSKIVVAPSKWFNDSKLDTTDLLPESWIRL